MTKYRPFLLALAVLGLAALVWLDNREAIMAMFAPPDAIVSSDSPEADNLSESVPSDSDPPEVLPSSERALLRGNPLAGFDKTQLENWVQRPLFAPSRKMPPPQEAETASEAPHSPPDYQLLGVVLEANGAIAVLRKASTGAGIRVQVGDTIGGWLVAAVERDAVTLQRDQEEPQIIRFRKACSKSAGATCP